MRLRFFALALTLTLALALVAPVFAHAELVRSLPEANATLDRAPAQVELFFSEALEPSFSEIQVLDSNGVRVDNADTRVDVADPAHLTVSLRSLPDGVYTAAWKVLSAVDGHVTGGAFPFAVGNVDAAALQNAAQASRQIKLSLGEVVTRWLTYLSALALAGGMLFVLVVWQPAVRAAQAEAEDFGSDQTLWPRLGAFALAGLAAANGLGLLLHAGQASGAEIAAPWEAAVGRILFDTRFGALWIARFVLTLALVGLRLPGSRSRWLAFGVSLLLLLTISLGSHAAAEPRPALPVFADWLHLVAASVWVGGLTHFAAGMWSARQIDSSLRTRLAALLIPRFSALALLSVGAVTLSGAYSAFLRLGALEALTGTLYGRTLVVKLLIILPMLALGVVNLLFVTPRMKRAAAEAGGDAGLVNRFRRIVTGEVILGAALLLSVGVFTALPPAQPTSTSAALTAAARADDLRLSLEIAPGRIGVNTFTLRVTAAGQPVDQAKEALLRFTPTNANLPPSEAPLAAQGNGVYTARGAYLSLPGQWQVQAVVRREDKFDAFVNFNLEVGAASTSTAFPWTRVTGGGLLVAGIVFVAAAQSLGRTRARQIAFAAAPAVALFAVGAFVYYRPPAAPGAELVNPIPPNADSVARGKAVYEANCVPCHGVSGKGDGPVGLTLSPRPADLSLHAIPGVHTDAQLYEWITNGFPGSVMPAFSDRLTSEERWNLVNYIRTLAPK
jgi:copper transport protein